MFFFFSIAVFTKSVSVPTFFKYIYIFSVFHRSKKAIQVYNDIFYQKYCNAYISFMIKRVSTVVKKQITPTYSWLEIHTCMWENDKLIRKCLFWSDKDKYQCICLCLRKTSQIQSFIHKLCIHWYCVYIYKIYITVIHNISKSVVGLWQKLMYLGSLSVLRCLKTIINTYVFRIFPFPCSFVSSVTSVSLSFWSLSSPLSSYVLPPPILAIWAEPTRVT